MIPEKRKTAVERNSYALSGEEYYFLIADWRTRKRGLAQYKEKVNGRGGEGSLLPWKTGSHATPVSRPAARPEKERKALT